MSESTNKAERLASAVYLLTSFFSDSEPLKWRLRSLSSDLVSVSSGLKDSASEPLSATRLRTGEITQEILSHLRVCKNAGLISEANHALVQEEFSKFVGKSGVNEALSEVFKESLRLEPAYEPARNPEPVVKDKISERAPSPAPRPETQTEYLPRVEAEAERKSGLKEFGAVSVKKNARQSAIIGLLKRKKEIMIKDVSSVISDCSEKTIQRELLAMVKAGILKKTGEKRWSRYSLA